MKIKRPWLIVFSLIVCLSSMLLVTKASFKKRDLSSPWITLEVAVPPPDRLLSVEETIGLSLLGESLPYHLFQRANPEAKEELYRLLDANDEGLYRFQGNAYWILGYIGDADDAIRMRNTLYEFSGVLSRAQCKKVVAMFFGLGLMSRRGINTASDILDEMTDAGYWSDAFKWRPDEFVTSNHLTAELESLAWVMLAQTIAGRRDDLTDIRNELLANISVRERRQYMAHRIDPFRNKAEADGMLRNEKKIPTAEEHAMLKLLYDEREERLQSESDAYKERPAAQR